MTIDYSDFTLPALQVVTHAAAAAKEMDHTSISPDHLLIGLIRNGDETVSRALAPAGITEELVRVAILDGSEPSPTSQFHDPLPSPSAELALLDAENVANGNGDRHITPVHILESLLIGSQRRTSVLLEMGFGNVIKNRLADIDAESVSPVASESPTDLVTQLRALATKLTAPTDRRYKSDWELGQDAGEQNAGRQLAKILGGIDQDV